jgi:hypothetical protein
METLVVTDSFDAAWQATANPASGSVPVQQLQHFLELVQLPADPQQLQQLVQDKQELNHDDM